MSDWNQAIVNEFRANAGKVGGYFENDTLLLLHHRGAKSGVERVTPVVTYMEGDRHVVIASAGGTDKHPDWYYNLLVNPEVTVELGTEQFAATAAEVPEPERTRLYEKMETFKSSFTEYKQKTARAMPVFLLTRTS
jgi:deazaflavin-dependent oxidoreductase (nitroreductase family)